MKIDRKKVTGFVRDYCVTHGSKFRLKDIDPADTKKIKSKEQANDLLALGVEAMSDMQTKLYAQGKWALLLVFQAMDAAGKDGTIKHVMSGINPQGCRVTSFKVPTNLDLKHDYLWRYNAALPERARSGFSTAATTRRCSCCACTRT